MIFHSVIRVALAASLMLLPLLASAQIYRIETEDGVIYTDQPPPADSGDKVEEIQLPDINTAPPPAPMPPRATQRPAETAAPELKVSILAPDNEATIAMGPGDFTVSASADPPLSRQEQLLLLIDGQPWGDAQSGGSWQVRGALRGPHDLVVERRTRGRTTARSEPVRVYVLRPSILRR